MSAGYIPDLIGVMDGRIVRYGIISCHFRDCSASGHGSGSSK